jgi:two-component system, sensor histidine kinase
MTAISPALARSVFDDAPDAMIIIDAFGTIWYANRRVCDLFGYTHAQMVGESIEKLVPERFRDRHIDHRGDFGSDVRVRPMGSGLDLLGRRHDGTEFPLEVSLGPIEDVGRTLVAAAIRDVTERKRAEAELVVARDAIEAMRELADRASSSGRRFSEAVVRQLRQQLQSLTLLNGSLREQLSGQHAAQALAQQGQTIDSMSGVLDSLSGEDKLD